ncbi:MAG: TraR/DksA C4-type zinc finger protein [Alicyclobacillus sp.]|nr:TraR/DksA C4-type zinc finger protein [Alicyclobacillus sp.]
MDSEAVRAELMRIKRDLEHRLEDTDSYGLNDAMRDQTSELSLADNHPADVASELFEREKDFGLRHLDHVRLNEVNLALQALADGTYGRCVECGQTIPEERLEANPLARLCIDCRRRQEARWTDLQRPIEEHVLWPGFGRTDLDGQDQTGFDGEDAWQAVARFNQRPGYDQDVEPHLERSYLDDNEGIVDPVDSISNEMYRAQRP